MLRKFRAVSQLNPAGGYSNPDNKGVGSNLKKSNYVEQQRTLTGINPETDIWGDLYMEDLIEMFEDYLKEKWDDPNASIALSEYDYETPLMARYDVSGLYDAEDIIMLKQLIRDTHLMDMVLSHEGSRVMILYGGAHFGGVHKRLMEADYKSLKKKEFFKLK